MIPEHIYDSPKVSVFFALSCTKIYGPFYFVENTITGIVYLDMPENFLILQITEDSPHRNLVFQQDGALPHFHADVRDFFISSSQVDR
jgi:hypothetical protein